MKTRFASIVIFALVLALALPQLGQAPVAAAAAPVALSVLPTTGLCHQLGEVIVASPMAITHYVRLPMVTKTLNCYTGQSYGGFTPGNPEPLQAAVHPDKNLAIRGYDNVASYNYPVGLVSIGDGSQSDAAAPSLITLLGRTPIFLNNYQAYDWDWGRGVRGKRLDPHDCPLPQGCWDVSVAGVQTTMGETLYLPTSGYGDIAGGVYYALVLYASYSSITLKYTSEDNVVWGYTIHVDNVCVDPNLLAAYNAHAIDRNPLPALYKHQAFGVALGSELRIAIRDNGTFMDPRSRYDWWDH